MMSNDNYLEFVRLTPTVLFEVFSQRIVRITPIVWIRTVRVCPTPLYKKALSLRLTPRRQIGTACPSYNRVIMRAMTFVAKILLPKSRCDENHTFATKVTFDHSHFFATKITFDDYLLIRIGQG